MGNVEPVNMSWGPFKRMAANFTAQAGYPGEQVPP